MKTLYEISAELEALMAQAAVYAAEHEGELPEDISDQLEALEMTREAKLGNVARYVKNLKAEAEMLAPEIAALSKRKKTAESKALYLKTYLAAFLGAGETYKDSTVALSWRASTAAEVTDDDSVPNSYCITERKPVLSEIKKALIAGKDVEGAKLVHKTNLQVK